MSRSASIKINDPKKKEIWAPCANCGKETAHEALTEVDLHDTSPDGDIQIWEQYYTVKCLGCKTVSFCEEYQNTEDLEYSSGGGIPISVQRVYPGRIAGRQLLEDIYQLPYGIARVYRQTHDALCNQITILAGVGLRVIVEAVCMEKKAKGKYLNEKINDLAAQGILTKDGCDILHSIRLLGNESAHKAKENTEEELLSAFEVVEHLLKTVYTIPQKAKKIRKKS